MAATRSEWLIDKTEAIGQRGMVTAMQPLAAEVGAAVLQRGGNAIDAAVAVGFAVGVVEPFMSGLGGIAFLVHRDGATGVTTCLDGSAMLPQAITDRQFEVEDAGQGGMYGWPATRGDAQNTGWLSPAVPGTPDLLWQAHQRLGRLPWAELVEPAIDLAENGFVVDHHIALMIAGHHDRLSLFPESRRTFLRPNGAPYTPSAGGTAEGGGEADRLRQPDLARTLRLVAEQGAEVCYRGEVAQLIVDEMAAHGGLVTLADLAAHRTVVREAVTRTYRGHQILTLLENTGSPTVLEALAILEGFDLSGLEPQSPELVHLVAEAVRRAFRDRLRHLGDADQLDIPYAGLLSADYVAERRATIDPHRATPEVSFGDPWPHQPGAARPIAGRDATMPDGHTTHINVVDDERSMVSLTSTLGQVFGSGVVVAGTGILLNNATTWFDPRPGATASLAPGRRTMSASSPMLLLRDGAPYAAVGAPGGRRIISALVQVLVNLLDLGLGVQASISAPRIHTEGPATEISTRHPAATLDQLAAMGHQVVGQPDTIAATSFARPSGIVVDGDTLRAGVHPYTPATAIGV